MNQQIEFVNQAIAGIFHGTPQEFLKYLEQDGNHLLHFYWDEIGRKCVESERKPFFGVDYEIRKTAPGMILVTITLPVPTIEGEAWYAAAAFRPFRVTPFLGIRDTTRFYTLEKDRVSSNTGLFCEIDRKLKREVLFDNCLVTRDDFIKMVLAEVG